MIKPFTYSMIFCITTLLMVVMVVMVSCNQAAVKSPDNSNKIQDTIQLSISSDNEKTANFDSIVKVPITILEADSYILECDESIINWYCVTHTGYVKFKQGKLLEYDRNIIDGDFEISMDSISNIDIDYQLMKDVLENTLKSEDFFDIKKFPLANFEIVRVKNISVDTYEVVGNLTISDVVNQIRFNSNISYQDSSIVVESERFSIDRTKWGITIYSKNFPQTDKSFLFTDFVEIQMVLYLKRNLKE